MSKSGYEQFKLGKDGVRAQYLAEREINLLTSDAGHEPTIDNGFDNHSCDAAESVAKGTIAYAAGRFQISFSEVKVTHKHRRTIQ